MEENRTTGSVTAEALKLGDRIVAALPPAFLLLVLMNVGFLGMVLYFLNNQMEQRMALATKILDACLVELKR